MKRSILYFFIAALVLVGIVVLAGVVRAQNSYMLRYTTVTAGNGVASGTGYEAQLIVGQLATGFSGGAGYRLLSGALHPPTSLPDVAYALPTRGTNDVPVTLNIYGAAFATNVTVTLSGPATVPLVDLARLSAGHVRGTVPVSTTPGMYSVSVVNPGAGSDTLPEAYQVIDASDDSLNDLYASEQDVWVYTPTLRSGQLANLGVRVHRQGGKQVISTTVRFCEDAPDGESIGEADTPLIAANDSENTGAVAWVPDEAGYHTIYAVIDPEDAFTETPADWAESNNVISRTFTVLPRATDSAPPRMDNFTINDGADQTGETDVWLDANGSEMDLAGQSGVSSIRYEEFEYSQGAKDWIMVHNSGWLDYETSHVNYPWALVDSSGLRYLRAWVADAAGNISVSPAVDFINYLPATEHVAAGGVNLYRRYVEAGEQLIVRVTPVSGDPDLYVWPPDWRDGGWSSINSGSTEDLISFEAPKSGVYQIEVYGYTAADYQLEITVNPAQTTAKLLTNVAAPNDKTPRGAPAVDPQDTPSNQLSVPQPPSRTTTEAGVDLSSGYEQDGETGSVVDYTHVITNTGDESDTFRLEAANSQGWTVTLKGGIWPEGTNRLPLQLDVEVTATFTVTVDIPDTVKASTTATTVVTATSQADSGVYDTLRDTTTVREYHIYLPLVLRE
jgi:hypothetical protein